MTFRHSGKLGDIVYSLAAVSAYPGARFVINSDGAHLHAPGAETILPLLNAQPYIEEAAIYGGEPFDHDFDIFRRRNVAYHNLADCHMQTLDLPPEQIHSRINDKWLFTEKAERLAGNGVIFARSGSWPGAPGMMEELYRAFGKGAFFVGTTAEWGSFQRDVGPIAFAPTHDLLQLAEVIAGCRLFVGNQSAPLAIAEGLKVPVMQAVYAPTPNCIFYRPGHIAIWSPTQVPGAVREFEAVR